MIPSARLFLAAFALAALAGCGGGGRAGSGGASTAAAGAKVSIAWPARARDVSAPGVANVATITIYYGQAAGESVSQVVQRPTGAVAQTTTTTLAPPVPKTLGQCLLLVQFSAGMDSLSAPLATAAINVRVQDDGTLVRTDGTALGTVGFNSNVVRVGLADGQTVKVGQTLDLTVTAQDKSGNVVALAPGAATFSVADGGAYVKVNADGSITGVAVGSATVVPTVAGLSGPASTVTVVQATLATRTVLAANSDFLYDASRSLFWLAVPYTDASGNSVRSLNPLSGSLGNPIFVGSDPSVLALSDDGSTLYAGIRGAGAVRRIDLVRNVAGLQFPLPPADDQSPTFALGLAVRPGHPGTVAATLRGANGTQGPLVFDDGVARPAHLGAGEGASVLWTADDQVVSVAQYSNETFSARVDASGATKTQDVQGGLNASSDPILANGRLYDNRGNIADAASLSRVGTFFPDETTFSPAVNIGPVIDAVANRAYFVQFDGVSQPTLLVFRLDTLAQVASRKLTDGNSPRFVQSTASVRLLRWGTKGLAFSLGDRIVLIDDVSGL